MRAVWGVLVGFVGLGAAIWLTAGPAGAVAPSAEVGADIAARWCAACHVIAPSGAGTDAAPSFASIARHRDSDYLKGFLARPHAKAMRGFNLTTREIDDVVAYIASLER
ncbi:MAG: c-type cytochrome [Actinomycetota bacterium]